MVVNALGALASGSVLLTAGDRIVQGAWVVVVAVPLLALLLLWIEAHYTAVERQTSVSNTHSAVHIVPSPDAVDDNGMPPGPDLGAEEVPRLASSIRLGSPRLGLVGLGS